MSDQLQADLEKLQNDLDGSTFSLAQKWIALHGHEAATKAGGMVQQARRKGDTIGAEVWARVVAAIATLETRARPKERS